MSRYLHERNVHFDANSPRNWSYFVDIARGRTAPPYLWWSRHYRYSHLTLLSHYQYSDLRRGKSITCTTLWQKVSEDKFYISRVNVVWVEIRCQAGFLAREQIWSKNEIIISRWYWGAVNFLVDGLSINGNGKICAIFVCDRKM